VSLVLDRVRCPACLWLIERHLRAQPGVTEAAAGYAGQSARVVWDPSRTSLSRIRTAVREIGYEARPFDPAHRVGIERDAARRGAARLVFAGVLGMMVMNLALAAYFLGGPDASGSLPLWERFERWCALLASAVLLAYPGQDFFAGAWRDLRRRKVGMDTPIVLGLWAAWLGIARATVGGIGPVYFDAIAMLVFFVLRPRLETRALRPRRRSIVGGRSARDGAPRGAAASRSPPSISRPATSFPYVPGRSSPADGVLLEASRLREAVLTGEPWPRRRRPGMRSSPVAAIGPARLFRVTRAGEASTLRSPAPVREVSQPVRDCRTADRLADRLVVVPPLGATASSGVAGSAAALPATIAVLMVTCPCALASRRRSPTVAAGRFAGSACFRRAWSSQADGRRWHGGFRQDRTLTLSRPSRSPHDGGLDSKALTVASALEAASPHPIAGPCARPSPPPGRVRGAPAHRGRGRHRTVRGARWCSFARVRGGRGEVPSGLGGLALAGGRRLAALLADRKGGAKRSSLAGAAARGPRGRRGPRRAGPSRGASPGRRGRVERRPRARVR
jgi:Cu2+-exporting ATPase